MKSIFKFASALAFVLAAGAVLASCEKPAGPDEVPGPMEYPANPMTFTVDGTETPVGKAFADTFEEYVLITVTPDTEVESYVDAVTADGVEYLQFMVLPQNLNREIDLVAEPQRIYCKDNESDCTVISPDGNLTEGKAVVQYDEETSEVVFKLAIELSDGTVVGVNAGALMSAPAPEQGGTITVDGTQEPVRGAFYLEDSGNTALYFTSSEVYTFEELQEMALYYFLIMVPDGLMTGEDFDMADLSGEDNVVVMYIDYVNGGQYEANSGDGGASLTFNMQKTSDGTYAASISAAFDGGPEIAVDFDGGSNEEIRTGSLKLDYAPIQRLDDPEYFRHFTLSKFDGQSFSLLNYPDFEKWSILFRHPSTIASGYYMMVSGTRLASGKVLAKVSFFTVADDALTNAALVMRDDREDIRVIGSFNSESKFTEAVSGKETSVLLTTGRGYFAVGVLAVGQEPTDHALKDIAAKAAELERWGRKIILLFPDRESYDKYMSAPVSGLPGNVVFGIDNGGNIRNQILSEMKLPAVTQMPVFIVADTFNRVVFESHGYTIGLGEQLLKTIHGL